LKLTEGAQELQAGSSVEVQPKRSTGKHRLLTIEDLDRRTRAAQHARDLRDGIHADLGGADRLSTLQTILVDSAAVIAVMLGDLKTRWLAGHDIDVGTVSTLQNTLNRTGAMLGLERLARDTPDLRAYLSSVRMEQGDLSDTPAPPADPDDSDAGNDNAPVSEAEEFDAPEPEPPAQVGDIVKVEGGLIKFVGHHRDGRQRWAIMRLSGEVLEEHFGRDAAEARAKKLAAEGRL
jgi:hypothetical protein